ncbi:non-reducing end beta-L-arabinofuranosidase [Abditibacteriota bacterium]|nr:non-reducing end beta-L-arabinofuranosidase [Abditibacteriota bacterium]
MSTARFNPIIDLSKSPHARLQPVPASAVELSDTFWEPRRHINREATITSQFQKLEESGCFDNFRRAIGRKQGDFRGPVFMDSDVYKWLEAASSTLATHPTPELEAMVETAIELIEAAQQPDGYLNTHFMFDKAKDRWRNLRDDHEMYCAGHFIQAAVAHHRATGSPRLLKVAQGVADNICATFGPIEQGKKLGTCGHPEIEMALVELYRATSEKRYLDEALFLVDMRGQNPSVCYEGQPLGLGGRYYQDHVPYRQLEEVTGHAVRMLYLAAGATDIVLETGEEALREALDKQWDNMTSKRLYITGGLGARYEGEAFGKNYELPNERAYTETCAAIASVMWNLRLLNLQPQEHYADLLEHTLYNAVLPGLSLDGAHYYYQNPLTDDGTHRRRAWFGCACCPPNVARLLAQLPGYFYSVSNQDVWVHLYAAGTLKTTLKNGQSVEFKTTTNYPWDGTVEIELASGGKFGLFLRVPGWSAAGATLLINGEAFTGEILPGTYVELNREWQAGDKVTLQIPMPVRRIFCHPYVADNLHRVALQRGPILYAIESTDVSVDVRNLVLPATADIEATPRPDLLGGVVVLSGSAITSNDSETSPLYGYSRSPQLEGDPVDFTAIPYYAWANRDASPMQVWLREM